MSSLAAASAHLAPFLDSVWKKMSILVSVLKSPLDATAEETGVEVAPGVFVYSPALRTDANGRRYSLSGSGVLDHTFVNGGSRLPSEQVAAALSDPSQFSRRLRGSVAVFVFDPVAGTGVFVPDPLGSCPLHVYEDGTRLVVTSDLSLLRNHGREHGVELKKSAAHVATMFATGVGGLGSHPYDNVRLIDQMSLVRVGPGRLETQRFDLGSEIERYRSLPYADGLEAVRNEIRDNVLAFHGAGHSSRISHLTGGFDSRLVLSFLQHEGVQGEFSFFCSGSAAEPDRQVFERLARHYGLTSSMSSGISVRRHAESFREEAVGSLELSHGLTVGGPTGEWLRTDTGILAGGYGELLRAFYSPRRNPAVPFDAKEAVRLAWGQSISSDLHGAFLSAITVERLASQAWAAVSEAASLGLDEDAQLDYLYLHRARMFVGQTTYMHSPFVDRFDPLFSLAGTALALVSPAVVRRANAIGFDLMDRNVPDLKALPFDSERFSSDYVNLRQMPPGAQWANSDMALKQAWPLRLPAERRSVNYTPTATAEQIAWAREKRATLRHVVWSETVRAENLRIIRSMSDDPAFREAFEVENLRRALGRPFSNRVILRSMISLYGLLQWYASP